ncbi:protein of unknown function [Nannocystis exedens]|uniref:Uncharacterized protein n=1 Tax=Nannocystis exedens TaxID=54 RepID=A0A1I2J2J1_9BACT|nr:DUF1993 family protein [Nannocystis exedens]PCC68180.1 hypothetical protein NAEX_01189 [Nannocystis exedens]SFF46951.1 protein of unknown function [Nannocystis exedens]
MRRLSAALVFVASACTADAPGFAAFTAAWNLAKGTGRTTGEKAPTSAVSALTIIACSSAKGTGPLPNFHFHAVTAYDILRSHGVPIGKRDYEGQLRSRTA